MGDKIQAHKKIDFQCRSVQSLSRVWFFAAPGTAAHQASLYHQHPELCSHSHLLSWWCHPTISSSVVPFSSHLQPFPASGSFQSFQWIHRTDFSFRMDWIDLLAVQGTLKSFLQHHSSKASIIQGSALFIVQLSHPYMTTGKAISLTRQTFVGKLMSLLFNMLSRLVIAFLPRSKRLLISWLQLPSEVILEPPQNKVSHCFHCFPIYFPWSDRTGCHDLHFLNAEF